MKSQVDDELLKALSGLIICGVYVLDFLTFQFFRMTDRAYNIYNFSLFSDLMFFVIFIGALIRLWRAPVKGKNHINDIVVQEALTIIVAIMDCAGAGIQVFLPISDGIDIFRFSFLFMLCFYFLYQSVLVLIKMR